MEHILSAAERILRTSGAPALRLGLLASELKGALGGVAPDAARLRSLLEGHPDRFRILDPWRGPWRLIAEAHPPGEAEPWVVAVRDLGDTPGSHGQGHLARRVRESVRWLALSVDPTSYVGIIRWQEMMAGAAAAARVLDKAA